VFTAAAHAERAAEFLRGVAMNATAEVNSARAATLSSQPSGTSGF
jgi:hypothetical protein